MPTFESWILLCTGDACAAKKDNNKSPGRQKVVRFPNPPDQAIGSNCTKTHIFNLIFVSDLVGLCCQPANAAHRLWNWIFSTLPLTGAWQNTIFNLSLLISFRTSQILFIIAVDKRSNFDGWWAGLVPRLPGLGSASWHLAWPSPGWPGKSAAVYLFKL